MYCESCMDEEGKPRFPHPLILSGILWLCSHPRGLQTQGEKSHFPARSLERASASFSSHSSLYFFSAETLSAGLRSGTTDGPPGMIQVNVGRMMWDFERERQPAPALLCLSSASRSLPILIPSSNLEASPATPATQTCQSDILRGVCTAMPFEHACSSGWRHGELPACAPRLLRGLQPLRYRHLQWT